MSGGGSRDQPWWPVADGLAVRIRLTPRSSRPSIDGVIGTANGAAVAARVTAVPEDGRANDALVALIADWAGVPKGSTTIAAGYKSRIKMVTIRCGDGLAERLGAQLSAMGTSRGS